jgi:hypothetical protein
MQRPLALLALAALSVAGWSALRNKHQQHLATKPHAKPEALQTWEGEGGGLPGGGPGQHAAASMPAGDAAVFADTAEREASA